jgi:hypothetical protein
VAVGAQRLLEVTLAVEQADADEGQPHVAGRLAVVAGQNAEAAGVDRQAFVETEFGAEVGDQVVRFERVTMHVRHVRRLVVGLEGGGDAIQGADEHRVFGGGFETLLVGALEECLGVVVGGFPQRMREAGEKALGRAIPAVPQVVGEIFELRQTLRNLRVNFEGVNSSGHGWLGSMMS